MDHPQSQRSSTRMSLPEHIPAGVRVVVRRADGVDERTGRGVFRDAVGHVMQWDGKTLTLLRDESANGTRPAQVISIDASTIVRLKPVPERPAHYPSVSRA